MAADRALDLEQLRTSTKELVGDLEAELRSVEESTAEGPDDEHDPEGATVGFERARVGALLEQARRSLTEIDRAIERVRSGSYGVCVGCGKPIASERLEALPMTEQCRNCAAG